jgi:hypothetical protein
MKVIGFTGHRDRVTTEAELLSVEGVYPGATWVHGGAIGFDSQVHEIGLRIGKVEGETLIVIRPDYKRYDAKVAPIMRNRIIVDRSDVLYACWDGRRTGGTYDTIKYAKSKKVFVGYLDCEVTG